MSYFMARFIRLFLFFYTKNVKISPSHYLFDHNQLTACSCLSSCCFSQDELTMVQRSIIELKKKSMAVTFNDDSMNRMVKTVKKANKNT